MELQRDVTDTMFKGKFSPKVEKKTLKKFLVNYCFDLYLKGLHCSHGVLFFNLDTHFIHVFNDG